MSEVESMSEQVPAKRNSPYLDGNDAGMFPQMIAITSARSSMGDVLALSATRRIASRTWMKCAPICTRIAVKKTVRLGNPFFDSRKPARPFRRP